MRKFQEDNPNNCRIYIDYNKKEPVRFEYVKKEGAFKIVLITSYEIFIVAMVFLTLILMLDSLILVINNSDLALNIHSVLVEKSYFFIPFAFINLFTFPVAIALLIYTKKEWLRGVPHLNVFISRVMGLGKYYSYTFKPEDIKDLKVEIPMFANVMLDYKATKEMSKYLDRVEILEHPFKFHKRSKITPNEFLWKANFYFKEMPKTGQIFVKFI